MTEFIATFWFGAFLLSERWKCSGMGRHLCRHHRTQKGRRDAAEKTNGDLTGAAGSHRLGSWELDRAHKPGEVVGRGVLVSSGFNRRSVVQPMSCVRGRASRRPRRRQRLAVQGVRYARIETPTKSSIGWSRKSIG